MDFVIKLSTSFPMIIIDSFFVDLLTRYFCKKLDAIISDEHYSLTHRLRYVPFSF